MFLAAVAAEGSFSTEVGRGYVMRRICACLACGVTVVMLAMVLSALVAAEAATARAPGRPVAGIAGVAGVVVNDFAPSGPGGSADEYLELRNTSGQLVVLDGWGLAACMSGASPLALVVFGSSDFIVQIGRAHV